MIKGVQQKMTRRFGAVLLCCAVACGGGNKAKTTPTAGSGSGKTDDQSMKDGPNVGNPPDGGNGVQLPVGTPGGDGAGSGSATAPGQPPPYVPPPDPVVQMPSYDPDPAIAKSEVDRHLGVARNALSQTPADGETALKEAKAALAVDASSIEAAAMVAFAYYHKKQYDTAELVLDDVFKREVAKTNPNINYVYGLIYDKTNRPAQAALAFNKAVELSPNFASALVNQGVHQLMNQQYGAAQTTFEKLTTQLNRNDAVTLTSLGSAYRGRASEFPATAAEHDQFVKSADGAYKKALQVNVNYGIAYYNLGLLYLDNQPFPGIPDVVQSLTMSKDFFDKYKAAPGFDLKTYDARIKDVDKAIKKAQKAAKKKAATP